MTDKMHERFEPDYYEKYNHNDAAYVIDVVRKRVSVRLWCFKVFRKFWRRSRVDHITSILEVGGEQHVAQW